MPPVRRCLPTLIALLALLAPASALAAAADKTVQIQDGGYVPATVTITPGQTVTWTHNNPVTSHGVQFDGESTPQCAPGVTVGAPPCSPDPRPFPTAGRYRYYDPATLGCTSYATCSVRGMVVVYLPPTASFAAAPNPANRGSTVNFDGSGSVSPGGSITAYSWDFGDGTTGSGQTASHAYTVAGTYNVTLTVTDDQGQPASQTQQVTINVPDSDGDGVDDDHDACPTVPGLPPDGCPHPLPPPIQAKLTTAALLGAAGISKSGVNVVLDCSGICTAVFKLVPAKGVPGARPGDVLGTGTAAVFAPGNTLVTVPILPSARAKLARAKNAVLRLEAVVADSVGRTRTVSSTIQVQAIKTSGRLPAIGISDQQPDTFRDPLFKVLKLKYARLVTPWNSIFRERARLDDWLQSARALGVRPLVSFEHTRGQTCPGRRCVGPTTKQFAQAWRAFHAKYPWVTDVSPWNEANSGTQPTGKRPDLAAAYYNVVRGSCRGCSIVAADVLDAPNLRAYLRTFLARAKGKPRLWGLHNYTDTNRFRQTGTRTLLSAVRGIVWFTETGGVVKFTTQRGVRALPPSESRAKKAMDYMFKLAEIDSRRVKRIYIYQWKVNNKRDRFDAGVVRPDGTPRPSFHVLTLNASIARAR